MTYTELPLDKVALFRPYHRRVEHMICKEFGAEALGTAGNRHRGRGRRYLYGDLERARAYRCGLLGKSRENGGALGEEWSEWYEHGVSDRARLNGDLVTITVEPIDDMDFGNYEARRMGLTE